jgi:hypothetical protein
MNNHDQDSEAPASFALSQSDEEVELPTDPTDDELDRVARSLLSAGRANLPLKIEGEPLSPDDPHRHFTHIKLDTPEFVRMWMGALLQRTLDGYEATLLLRRAALDADARAHIRIAFEHLCAFAWVSANPSDPEPPLRIARHGMGFFEQQLVEMAHQQHPLTDAQLRELGFAIQVNQSDLKKPPSARDLCAELDDAWVGRLPELAKGTQRSFGAWYSYLFRGASAFVHPTSTGIEPSLVRAPGAFFVTPSRVRQRRVLELCAMHLSIAIGLASLACADLIDESPLQGLGNMRHVS